MRTSRKYYSNGSISGPTRIVSTFGESGSVHQQHDLMERKVILFLLIFAFTCSECWSMEDFLGDDAMELAMHPDQVYYENRADSTAPASEKDQDHWQKAAWMQLRSALNTVPNVSKAKNAILFLGDGMSLTTVTAARIYSGQLQGSDGEESSIIFDKFPYVGLSKTYSVNNQVSDSASTATAYLGGVKTNTGLLGLTAAVKRGDCLASLNQSTHVHSILKWAQDAGMSTGIVTTTRVTHASPAGGYAHVADRNWENDSDVAKSGKDPKVCQDIAMQLITGDTGRNLNVIMGGGRRNFLPRTSSDEKLERGKRRDGKNLIKQWQMDKNNRQLRSKYVWDKKGLMSVDAQSTEYLLGLFESSHMKYHLEMNEKTDPTLAEMTAVAIDILKKNPNGYVLFVEGGRIDHGHHDTKAHLALDETVQMAEAVAVASAATSERDTLMLVTADHAHTMTISGYSPRGNSIFDAAGISNVDGMLYTTLSYANGPGYKNPNYRKHDLREDEQSEGWMDDIASFVSSRGKASIKRKTKCQRHDISGDNLADVCYGYPSTVPMTSETHGGEDVPVYAKGPRAYVFSGTYEQNYIMHATCYALGIGPASSWSLPQG